MDDYRERREEVTDVLERQEPLKVEGQQAATQGFRPLFRHGGRIIIGRLRLVALSAVQ